MLPLIPAIILLLLQGSAGADRLPRDVRLPESWLALEQAHLAADPRAEATFAQLLEYVSGTAVNAARPNEARHVGDGPGEQTGQVRTPPPVVDARLRDGFQECRRSRDGPDSIA